MKTKWMTIVALALLGITVSSSRASAAQITFQYFTDACFGTGCTPATTDVSQTVSNSGLSFANEVLFTGTSAGGSLTGTMGTFTLDPTGNDSWSSEPFALRVTFLGPMGIDGGQDQIFSAVINGTASSAPGQCSKQNVDAPCGSVNIDFPSTPVAFTFNDGVTVGSFNLLVNDLTVAVSSETNPGVGTLTGSFTDASERTLTSDPVPEPASLALVGSGLAAAFVRRRRRA